MKHCTLVTSALCLALSLPSSAEDTFEFSFAGKAGLEYDSKLSIQEIDRTSSASDTARRLDARFAGRINFSEDSRLKASYGLNSKNYREQDSFDQQLRSLSLDASHDFSAFTLGTLYHHNAAKLDSADFLELDQKSLYAGRLFGDQVYLRGAVNRKSKVFADNPARNADVRGYDADVFIFFNQARSFVSFGWTGEQDDARVDSFDYASNGLRARYSNKFRAFNADNQLELGLRFEEKDYDEVDLLLGTERRDLRRSFELSWSVGLNSVLTLQSKVQHGRHDSTLASADYNETTASLILEADF